MNTASLEQLDFEAKLTCMKLADVMQRLRHVHPDFSAAQIEIFLRFAGWTAMKDNDYQAYPTQSDITRIMDLNDSTLSRNTAILAEFGNRNVTGLRLISVRENPTNRREKVVFLTAKGKQLVKDIVTTLEK